MRHNTPNDGIIHTPVMWREVLEFAKQAADGIFVDCTLGEGGHTELLLNEYKNLRIIGFERDEGILEIAKERLRDFQDRLEFVNDNFANIAEYLKGRKISGFLYDFGISSYHFEKSGRGFSLSADEPLDMRLSLDAELNADIVVNEYPEERLCRIFGEYGEERWSGRIARNICEKRSAKRIETTAELAGVVAGAIPARYRVKNIHPATRVFQAVRIEVNDELNAIARSLKDAYGLLEKGGVMIAISFHSLEDRIVKNEFRRLAKGCVCGLPGNQCMCTGGPMVSILTKKPMLPGEDEVRINRRSRSAKLRACVRVR